jgi:outer membrane immunogenic protein
MHRLVVASLAAAGVGIGLTAVASAADLGGPAPAPVYTKAPPPVVYDWNGFYGGLNAGGTRANNNSVNTVSSPVTGFVDGIGPGSFAAISALGATGNIPLGNNASIIGGGQIGYNWQFAPTWLAGLEADIQGVSHNGGDGALGTSLGFGASGFGPDTIKTQITSSSSLDYFGTVRGRLGFVATPTVLLYGTGGLAYGGVKTRTSISQSNDDCVNFPGGCVQSSAATTGSLSTTRAGWTAGAGVEWMFWQHWSAKAEYLYYDLGSVTYNNGSLAYTQGSLGGEGGPVVISSQSTTKFTGNIARVGVNYHF